MDTRACKICHEVKPLTPVFFLKTYNTRKDGTKVQGFRNECKVCKDAKDQASRQARKGHKTPDNTPKPTDCSNPGCVCLPSERAFAWRDDTKDWRSECKACTAERNRREGYSQKHRAKRVAELGHEAYRAAMNKTHRAWVANNPDKMLEYSHRAYANAGFRFRQLVTKLESRAVKLNCNIGDLIDLDEAPTLMAKMTMACHYCDRLPYAVEGKVNGLDRLAPGGRYSDANTVPCCGQLCALHTQRRQFHQSCAQDCCTPGS
jgi:hypothetical protein